MRETGSTETSADSSEENEQQRFDDALGDADLEDYENDEPAFDWTVFLFRAAALVTFGATLITSIDLSINQDVDWLTVMRLSILPFVGGMLVLAAGELLDRRGD